jgi:hypothetical protein
VAVRAAAPQIASIGAQGNIPQRGGATDTTEEGILAHTLGGGEGAPAIGEGPAVTVGGTAREIAGTGIISPAIGSIIGEGEGTLPLRQARIPALGPHLVHLGLPLGKDAKREIMTHAERGAALPGGTLTCIRISRSVKPMLCWVGLILTLI